MRVWLLHVSEELPMDGSNRTFRYGYLAEALQARGHQVLRWAPTFRHRTKQHRFPSDHRLNISPGYEIQLVHSSGYRRHVGLARLRAYRELGRRLLSLAHHETPPDLMVTAIPSLEWAEATVQLGSRWNVPVVVDIRDLWPDIYLNVLPRYGRTIGRLLLNSQYQRASYICRQATMLTAVSQSYLEWGLNSASRAKSPLDQVLPLGYEKLVIPPVTQSAAEQLLRRLGVDLDRPICLFAGRFERSYDLQTVIDAARRLECAGTSDVQFVLCGGGSREAKYRRRASGIKSVFFTGWIDAATLQAIASLSTFGLCAYASDATQSVPNKPFEYMASGLVVVSSLPGDMKQLIEQHRCGINYAAGKADSLANQLKRLLTDRENLRQMQANSYSAWDAHYQSRKLYSCFAARLEHLGTANAYAA